MIREYTNYKVLKQESKYGNIQTNQPSKKLDQKKYRSFVIKEKIKQEAYRLELPEGQTIHDVFNEDLLTCCRKVEFASQHKDPAPLPNIINEKEEYKVEEIRGYRKKGRNTQFLVHWKEYRNEHDQQIAETNLLHAKEAIKDYQTQLSRQNL